ncbi:hypothetical protein [uncultured Hymenobacter sp.]|uniref:hypothetical protein n=1 Tax=uncultured Hymenobacter sp. TaxID=170016 RepID=UPI0035CADFA7
MGESVPLAYTHLVVFDKNENCVASEIRQLGVVVLSHYEDLRVALNVPGDIYVLACVGNESDTDLYFDDGEFLHRPGVCALTLE